MGFSKVSCQGLGLGFIGFWIKGRVSCIGEGLGFRIELRFGLVECKAV